MSDLLSPEAAADRRGCSARSIHDAIAAGRLRAVRVIGPRGAVVCYAIDPGDLDAYRPPRRGRPPTRLQDDLPPP